MTAGTAVLACSICGEPSLYICVYCTKDACANHRCDRCKRCSDCCECDVPLSAEDTPIELAAEAPVEIVAEREASIFAPEPEPILPPQQTPPSEDITP